uniref:Acid sensing ion channel subunit 1 n=1 Tax=Gallus gallus TaxID=9031 RepID=A0A8V0ZZR2_CHICK
MMDLKVDEEEVDSGQPVSIQAFASSSTLHGISHIFSYERLSLKRVVWALCFMGSLALLALVCTNRIQYYFLYPHVTKLDEVAATRLTFPAVTFCNLNEFRFSRVTKNDLYHAGELLALLNNRYEIPDTQTADEKQLEILQDKANFRNFKPKPFNMLEFYDRAGHDIREMLLSCFFRGEQCSPEDFKVVFTRYGKCYTFNAGQDGKPRLITMKGGTGNGLEIMLDIQQDEYLPVWGETDETSFEAGIKVQIHSQDEPPLIDQLGFGVAPGFQTFVSCQEQRLIYLPPPWGDCKATTGDSEFYDTYSITACRIDCETRYLVENCNCRMVHMPGDAPYCTPEHRSMCTERSSSTSPKCLPRPLPRGWQRWAAGGAAWRAADWGTAEGLWPGHGVGPCDGVGLRHSVRPHHGVGPSHGVGPRHDVRPCHSVGPHCPVTAWPPYPKTPGNLGFPPCSPQNSHPGGEKHKESIWAAIGAPTSIRGQV